MNLKFIDNGVVPGQVTRRWIVASIHNPYAALGVVRWYAPWRRYNFFPEAGATFDASCLTEIAQFLSAQTSDRKEKR